MVLVTLELKVKHSVALAGASRLAPQQPPFGHARTHLQREDL